MITEKSMYHIEIGEVTYAVPVGVIARDRAKYYASRDFGGDIERSLSEDTMPLFQNVNEIHEWASNNMCWSDVVYYAIILYDQRQEPDYENEWINGEWDVKS